MHPKKRKLIEDIKKIKGFIRMLDTLGEEKTLKKNEEYAITGDTTTLITKR